MAVLPKLTMLAAKGTYTPPPNDSPTVRLEMAEAFTMVVSKKAPARTAVPSSVQPGASQLDSGVGAGFWLYEVCMYVYEKS